MTKIHQGILAAVARRPSGFPTPSLATMLTDTASPRRASGRPRDEDNPVARERHVTATLRWRLAGISAEDVAAEYEISTRTLKRWEALAATYDDPGGALIRGLKQARAPRNKANR